MNLLGVLLAMCIVANTALKTLPKVLALVATAMSEESNVELLKASNELFTANIFQEVVKANPGENLVMSAFSVLSPLAQLALGSVGTSYDEILKVIGLSNNMTKEVFTDETKQLRSVTGDGLSQANRVYVRQGAVLNAVSKDVFNSDVKNVDFTKNVEAAQEIITWVEDNTNHKIKDLVSSDSLDATTAAVLVNTIYFEGKWKDPFDAKQTTDRDFYVSKEKTIKKPTMHNYDYYKYGESKELDAKLLKLPYKGDQSSLLIVLPNENDGINFLVENLKDPSVLSKAVDNMCITRVAADLPKFKIETKTYLADVLKKMNIEKLLTPCKARLDNLLEGESDLFVSAAVQKAFIAVNEEGTEAAAANGESISFVGYGASYNADKKYFSIDRPFYFALIIDDIITFNGIVHK